MIKEGGKEEIEGGKKDILKEQNKVSNTTQTALYREEECDVTLLS